LESSYLEGGWHDWRDSGLRNQMMNDGSSNEPVQIAVAGAFERLWRVTLVER
jgi:hypothetical protein